MNCTHKPHYNVYSFRVNVQVCVYIQCTIPIFTNIVGPFTHFVVCMHVGHVVWPISSPHLVLMQMYACMRIMYTRTLSV